MPDPSGLTAAEFFDNPLSKLHELYEQSVFNLRPAPETATGEVMLASLMRNVGFVEPKVSIEGRVPKEGADLDKRIRKSFGTPRLPGQLMNAAEWHRVLTGMISSPRQKRETKRRNLSIAPLIPEASRYSLSARLTKNTWNPGNLVRILIAVGSPSIDAAQSTWNLVFEALSVGDDGDVFGKLLEQELQYWRPGAPPSPEEKLEWKARSIGDGLEWLTGIDLAASAPSRQFCSDLAALLPLKKLLTLRQWTSLLGTLVRLAAASHVLWECRINGIADQLIREALLPDALPPTRDQVTRVISSLPPFLNYGERAPEPIKSAVRDFITGRVAVNYLLCLLGEQIGQAELNRRIGTLGTIDGIVELLKLVVEQRAYLVQEDFQRNLARLLDRNPKTLQCTHGITNNVSEFLTYSISRRQTADEKDINYDQGYWIRKAATYHSAPWVVVAGPVALMTIVHCCCAGTSTPRTILDLAAHAERYGIALRANGAFDEKLIGSLRTLGLVLDSPDAEGGMMINPPFPS